MKSSTRKIFLMGMALAAIQVSAQELKDGYVKWGVNSTTFHKTLGSWIPGSAVNEDDNFFISRIRPKVRFRNKETQVRLDLNETNDKRLLAWLPFNTSGKNALPDGVFDSDVFSMWPYVSHWGNFSAPLGRVPGSLLDVAHKNGVAVSSVASIPYGEITDEYNTMLTGLAQQDAGKAAKFLSYYGVDGLDYNSEFYGDFEMLSNLRDFHAALVKKIKPVNPLFENIWYDGTDDDGNVSFDRGLGGHNKETWGYGDNVRTSLFFNYNWNKGDVLPNSEKMAKELGRSPLDLYCGVNMQGGEPKGTSWTLLKNYNLSIGLWGAHSESMFWESRAEKGSDADIKQRTYMLRTERWFTGGSRNPANCPEVINSMNYGADNTSFHGMSSFMTAKSSLQWNLSEEPFITYFNLGNGKYFNWKGERMNNLAWYNIGVQDYLPTWRWWFAGKLLGRTAADVPANGLDAEFSWDEAFVGGSCMRVFGSIAEEYLHLFKTQFALKSGDVITLRYKLKAGHTDMKLNLSAVGSETSAVAYDLCSVGDEANEDAWVEKKIVVGNDFDGKELALVALKFNNADALDLYLGEFTIVRGSFAKPAQPEITGAKMLAFSKAGMDAKVIFKMANNKPADEVCYNSDVQTSMFKLYAQQENENPVLMGITTSWAGLLYSIPVNFNAASEKVRIGVSAVSMDMATESEIAWTNYMEPVAYTSDDEIGISQTTIKPDEEFSLYYLDPKHEEGTWKVVDKNNNVKFEGKGREVVVKGLSEVGSYNLVLNGKVNGRETERVFAGYIQVTPWATGALPKVLALTANGAEADINVETNGKVAMAYTGRQADGTLSRAIDMQEKPVVFKAKDAGFNTANKAWTLSFWVKFNTIDGISGRTQLVDLRDPFTGWPQNNWGCFWSTYDSKSKTLTFTIRDNNYGGPEHTQNWKVDFAEGSWTHVAYVMEHKDGAGVRERIYINGKEAEALNWKLGDKTGNGYIEQYHNTTAWWDNAYMTIGIGRGGGEPCAAINGVIDDVKLFDRSLSAGDVAGSMYESAGKDNPTAFWNFEAEPGSDNWFVSTGTSKYKLALGETKSGEGEGQSTIVSITPAYQAGCPFVEGLAYKVTTGAKWQAKGGKVSDMTGNDKAGSANVAFAAKGDYTVKLTLSNSYGQGERTFRVIRVGGTSGIGDAVASGLRVYTVAEDVLVDFAEAGAYSVSVYNAAGQQVAGKAQQMVAGGMMRIHLNNKGVYIVRINKDGRNVRSVKLIRK